MRVRVKHHGHGRARWLVRALGLPFRLFPTMFAGWADDTITRMGVHATTHLDAPWHYGPTDSEGRRMRTIDEMPLELGFGPGVVFDMRHKAEGEAITRADMEAELGRTGAEVGPGVIALIRTGRDQYLGTAEYWRRGTGMSAEATEFSAGARGGGVRDRPMGVGPAVSRSDCGEQADGKIARCSGRGTWWGGGGRSGTWSSCVGLGSCRAMGSGCR